MIRFKTAWLGSLAMLLMATGAFAQTTTLTVDPNPSACGQKVTLNAVVDPADATGTVEFFDAGISLGTMTVMGGLASLSVATLEVGSHSLSANYSGDINHPASSGSATQVVNLGVSSVKLAADVNPSEFGQKVTFTATVSPAGATGTVEFFNDGTSLGTATVTGGTADLSVASLTAVSHTITATYGGDACNDVSTGITAQIVDKGAVQLTLDSDLNPSSCGLEVTFTATLTPAGATGSVEFFDDGTSLGTALVSGDAAGLSVGSLATGSHSITAVYGGDSNHQGASGGMKQDVDHGVSSILLTSSKNPTRCGDDLEFTAVVPQAGASGTVEFFDGGSSLGTALLSGGSANLAVGSLAVGNHSISATYSGDGCFDGATTKFTQIVNPITVKVTLVSSANPSLCGQKVLFLVTVVRSSSGGGGGGVPAPAVRGLVAPPLVGTVELFDGSTSLGTETLVDSTVSFSLAGLSVGSHTLKAVYSGDGCYNTGNRRLVQTVESSPTTVAVTSDINPAKTGLKVTFTATVTPAGATGTVDFYDDVTLLDSAPLVGASATLSIATLLPGHHPITARYSGDACYSPSTSDPYDQLIVPDEPPVVHVITPMTNETLMLATDYKISWSATDDNLVTSVDLYLSRDLGSTWETVALGEDNDGTLVWTVTGPPTSIDGKHHYLALVRIVAHDNSGQTGEDTSGPFEIFDPTTATVLSLFQAEPLTEGIRLRWQLSEPAMFPNQTLERGERLAGPWSLVGAERSAEGDVSVALDRTAEAGRTYFYRLAVATRSGQMVHFGPVSGTALVPVTEFAITYVRPNPTPGAANIGFAVPRESKVRLSLVDVQGREVAVLANGMVAAGRHDLSFDGRMSRSALPTGIYFVRLDAAGKRFVRRIIVAH